MDCKNGNCDMLTRNQRAITKRMIDLVNDFGVSQGDKRFFDRSFIFFHSTVFKFNWFKCQLTIKEITMSCQWFEFGWDKFRFSLPMESGRYSFEVRELIEKGYRAAEIQQVSRKKPTKYEKKLMTITGRGLAKGLVVSITAKDLENESEKIHNICPVTQVPFTYSEELLSDWSIDRIDNTRGYEPDNIVSVSVKVNQAKSNLNLDEMIEVCLKTYPNYRDLEKNEWFRMVSFYYNKMSLSGEFSITNLLDKKKGRLEYFVFLQLAYIKDSSSKYFFNVLKKYIQKSEYVPLLKLARKRVMKRKYLSDEVLFSSPKLCLQLAPVLNFIRHNKTIFDGCLLDCMYRRDKWAH